MLLFPQPALGGPHRPAARRHTSPVACTAAPATASPAGSPAGDAVAPAGVPVLADAPSVSLGPGVGPLLSQSAGVYAVSDASGQLQFVGISRRLGASLAAHVADGRLGAGACASARLHPLPGAGRDELQAAWRAWVDQVVASAGEPPPGNVGSTAWNTARPAPPRPRPELRLTAGKGLADVTVPLASLIRDVVTSVRVVAFIKGTRTAPECGFSQRLVDTLGAHGADFDVVNVLDEVHNPGLRAALKEFSAWPTIPQLYAHGELLGGSDTVAQLAADGLLAAKLAGPKAS